VTNLTIDEKLALEEVFIVLHNNKTDRINLVKKCIEFYENLKVFLKPKVALA